MITLPIPARERPPTDKEKEENSSKFYREDQSRDDHGRFADEGGGVSRGETGAITDAKTGEVLHVSNTGRPVGEDWQQNVDLPINNFLDKDIAVIHTHPDNTSFSDGDWGVFSWSNVKRMEAVTKSGVTFQLVKPAGFENPQFTPRVVKDEWNKHADQIFNTNENVEKGWDTEQIIDEVNKRMAKQFGITYQKT